MSNGIIHALLRIPLRAVAIPPRRINAPLGTPGSTRTAESVTHQDWRQVPDGGKQTILEASKNNKRRMDADSVAPLMHLSPIWWDSFLFDAFDARFDGATRLIPSLEGQKLWQ